VWGNRLTGQPANAGGGSADNGKQEDGVSHTSTPLRGISEIRRFFRTNPTPVYFV